MNAHQWFVGSCFSQDDGPLYFSSHTLVFDFDTQHWSSLPVHSRARFQSAMITDPRDGRLYLVGGRAPVGGLPDAVKTTDIWDGSAWTTIDLNDARSMHPIAFAAGTLIVSGGWGSRRPPIASVEILRTPEEGWLVVGDMPSGPRLAHTMTTLADDRHVLIVGGCEPSGLLNVPTDLYDAVTYAWRTTGALRVPRCAHDTVALLDGRAMVTGGGGEGSTIERSTEIFDPATERWKLAALMHHARFTHFSVVLPDGRVVVVGGSDFSDNASEGALASAEIYDPETDTWTDLPDMFERRAGPVGAVVGNTIYVAGGNDGSGPLATVEKLTIPPKDAPRPEEQGSCAVSSKSNERLSSLLPASFAAMIAVYIFRKKSKS